MDTAANNLTIEQLVLHRAPMLLLDSLICSDENSAEVLVNTKDSFLFANAEGQVPAWVGIEYMAQAVSAFAGIEAQKQGKALCMGFLLGTRKYTAQVTHFSHHQQLVVKVRELMRDETNLVLFNCQIYAGNTLLASAEIKAIQPKDNDAMLAQLSTSTSN